MIDQDGNEFIIENGKKKVVAKGKHIPTTVTFDENGNQIVIDKNGKTMKVEVD
jgi:hypothetical protein